MTYPSQDDILRVLSTIRTPDSRGNIIEYGMLSSLNAEEEEGGLHVQFVLEIDPQQAGPMELVRQRAEAAIQAVEGVTRATGILAAHKKAPSPSSTNRSQQSSNGLGDKKLPKGVKNVIAVASGKGGVGKSTVAVNLALALSRSGLSVGLLDADIYGPSVPRLLGANTEVEQNEDGRMLPVQAYGLQLMSIGFLVPEDAPMIWRGPMVHGAIKQMLYDVAWNHCDVLIVDMPPGTGDASLSVAQQVPLTGAVIVSTPQDIALVDVRKGIAMFQKVGVPIIGIVENMSYFECPHCHGRTDIFGHGGAKNDAERLEVPFLGHVPLDLVVRETSDAGTPIVACSPESTQAASFLSIAQRVVRSL